MQKAELQELYQDLDKYEYRYISKLRHDSKTSVKLFLLIRRLTEFKLKYGYDKNGKKKKISFLRILFSRELRKEVLAIFDEVIEIFKPSTDDESSDPS